MPAGDVYLAGGFDHRTAEYDVTSSQRRKNCKYLSGSKTPDYDLAQHIKNELKNNYILISTDGPFDSVIKSKPPMCFTKENAKRVVDTVRLVLEKHFN